MKLIIVVSDDLVLFNALLDPSEMNDLPIKFVNYWPSSHQVPNFMIPSIVSNDELRLSPVLLFRYYFTSVLYDLSSHVLHIFIFSIKFDSETCLNSRSTIINILIVSVWEGILLHGKCKVLEKTTFHIVVLS